MRVTNFYFILILLTVSSVWAQNSEGISTNASLDTSRVGKYLSLYDSLKSIEPQKAITSLNQALEISRSENDDEGLYNSLLAFGDHLAYGGKQDSAIIIYNQAKEIATKLGSRQKQLEALDAISVGLTYLQELDKSDSITQIAITLAKESPVDSISLIKCYNNLSNIAFYRDQYDASIAYDQLNLSYNKSDLSLRAKTLLNIGSSHYALGGYENAEDYFEQAYKTAEKANDQRMIAESYLELGRLNNKLNNYKEAKSYYELALQQYQVENDLNRIASIKHNLGELEFSQKNFDKAIEGFDAALEILEEIDSPFNEAFTIYRLGVAYLEKQNYSKAESYFLSAKSQYDEIGNLNMQRWVSSRLSELYAQTNKYKKAYTYLQDVKVKDDSLFTLNEAKNFREIEEKYQNEKKQKEIELLSAQNQISVLEIQKQTQFRNYLIIAAILLAALMAVIYNRYKLKAKANSKLKELDTIKNNFFTNISHEFRTPLTLILSPLQNLRLQSHNKETSESLEIIHRNATVLTELTNQILELSKIESGSLKLNVTEDNINVFLRVISASFESLAVAQNVTLSVYVDEAPTKAYYDSDKLQKILNNLLSNAFKFTSVEGEVQLKATHHNNTLSIAVSDTGKGISEEEQVHIFNRFYQSVNNTTHSAGTGVGLTLAKELAQLHNGDLSIKSVIGQGSTFTFSFPTDRTSYASSQIVDQASDVFVPDHKKSFSLEPEEIEPYDKLKTQILIVEDNPDLREHITKLLKDDYSISTAHNGIQGVEWALKNIPDLIITDLMMPEMDGMGLSEALKSNEKTSHIPIIFLTAKADRDTKLQSLKTGADDFLIKPFDNEELFVRVENIITQRQKLQEKFAQTLKLEPTKIIVKSKEEEFIKKALQMVNDNISNSDFTVEAFQTKMGMSRMQLHRKLKALTNFSASEFIRDIRLKRASELLSDNNLNVSEVAYTCGFNSVSYFTQCFTQKYGVNPSKYQSQDKI